MNASSDSGNLIRAGVALVPNREFRERIISLQESCRQQLELVPYLGESENLPHLTLFQGWFDTATQFDDLLEALGRSLFQNVPRPVIKVRRIKLFRPGWYFLIVEKEPWLAEMQSRLLKELRDLIRPVPAGSQKETDQYTPLETSNFFEYGYRFVGEAFLPHITLGRAEAAGEVDLERQLQGLFERSNVGREQRIESIAFYAVGDHGAFKRPLSVRTVAGS